MARHLRALAALALVLCGTPARAQTATSDPAESTSTSQQPAYVDDGWFDMSRFIGGRYGFLPIVMPITEPAVGYGGVGGMAFIDKPLGSEAAGYGRPNISFLGGLATENGTWGGMGGDMRYWFDDRLQTFGGILYASINLDYYGSGGKYVPGDRSLSYNLESAGGLARGLYRVGSSRVWGGLQYTYFATNVSFDAPDWTPGLPDYKKRSDIGGLIPSVTYDSRSNIFTPVTGTYVEASCALYSSALGGDDEFQNVTLIAMQYLPLGDRFYLGLRADAYASFGDAPFYMLPYIYMRGAPAMRYLGEVVLQGEVELRWQFWKRVSVVGFGGYGGTRNDFKRWEAKKTVGTGGGGLRYELARAYGIHAGIDVGVGPDNTSIYFITGSSWGRQ